MEIFQKILQQFQGLEPRLSERHRELLPFHRAYEKVTQNFLSFVEKDFFENPSLLEKLDATFADLYFRAVTPPVLPEIWQTLSKKRVLEPSKLFSLLLGANVHINHDLPLALQETITSPQDFRKDYFRANKVFKKALWEIYTDIEPSSEHGLRGKIVFWTIYHLISRWRTKAWTSSLRLKQKKITQKHLENTTLRKADHIRGVESFITK